LEDSADAAVLWYGNDIGGLDRVRDKHELLVRVRDGLESLSSEAYVV
jgi:hypothetical protein